MMFKIFNFAEGDKMTQANFTLWTNAALSDEDAANLVFFTHFVIHFLWSSDIFLSA